MGAFEDFMLLFGNKILKSHHPLSKTLLHSGFYFYNEKQTKCLQVRQSLSLDQQASGKYNVVW